MLSTENKERLSQQTGRIGPALARLRVLWPNIVQYREIHWANFLDQPTYHYVDVNLFQNIVLYRNNNTIGVSKPELNIISLYLKTWLFQIFTAIFTWNIWQGCLVLVDERLIYFCTLMLIYFCTLMFIEVLWNISRFSLSFTWIFEGCSLMAQFLSTKDIKFEIIQSIYVELLPHHVTFFNG